MSDSFSTRSLREIVRIVFQHWFLLLFIVVIGAGGTYTACRYVTPRYQSKVSLMFKRPADRTPVSADAGEKSLEVFVKAQQQIVMSDLVLARALVLATDEKLRADWLRLRDEWEKARNKGGDAVATAQDRIARFLGEEVEAKVQELLRGGNDALKRFRDSVKLETPGGEQVALTESFTLSVTRPAPAAEARSHMQAMFAADALADMYMVRYQELQQTLSSPPLRVMQEVINQVKEERREDIDAYEAYVREHSADIGILEQLLKSGTEHGTQVVLTKVRENDAQVALELEHDMAVFGVMKAILPENALEPGGVDAMTGPEVEQAVANVSVKFLRDNVGFDERVKELAKLETKRARAEAQYTPESREVQYLNEEILQSKRQLLRAVVAHAQGLDAGVKARRQQREGYGDLITSLTTEQNKIQAELARYAELKNNFQVAQRQLEDLEQKRLEAMSNWLRARDSVTITKLDKATLPNVDHPASPKPLLYTLVALMVSALVGLAAVFSVDHFDHTLRSAQEAERYLGLPVLGSVKKRGRRLLVST